MYLFTGYIFSKCSDDTNRKITIAQVKIMTNNIVDKNIEVLFNNSHTWMVLVKFIRVKQV